MPALNGPTMGWSSWNTYRVNITDSLIISQADAMVSQGLFDVGYNYINIDDGFFGGRDLKGQLLIHPIRFPRGLKPVVNHIHQLGLKAGIYSDAGRNTCGNYYDRDSIAQGVGLYGHDDEDADYFFTQLGFDFIKVDFCGGDAPQNTERLSLNEQERYEAISKSIIKTGRKDVRLNICRWNYPGTWVHDVAFSWRTTHDIQDNWTSVKNIIAENLYLSAYSSKGHFNDMDMLEVGRSMNNEEDKTHFGMWCMMNSPLLIGCDLTSIQDSILKLLKNKELIAINQDSLCQQAYVVNLSNGCYILVRDIIKLNSTKRAFAVYNPNDSEKITTVRFDDLCLSGSIRLRDVFEQKDLGSFVHEFHVSVPAHGTRIYLAEADFRMERKRYEAETAYISNYQELRNNQAECSGIYEYADNCSCGMKASWLGRSESNDLIWRNVYSDKGGEYTLSIAYISGETRGFSAEVNGESIGAYNVYSGNWKEVAIQSIKIKLQKGTNTIRLFNSSDNMPDIDYIELSDITL